MSARVVSPSASTQPIEAVWREFAEPLRGFLRRRASSAADADDLLQEVFVRIQTRLGTLQDASKLQGWVYRIARNVLVDHYRARREHVPIDFELEDDEVDGQGAVDLRPSLRRFIAQLPAAYREPLVRHEFQGQSLSEVATELNLSLTATKSRVQRARAMLRAMLDACCRFEFDRRGRVIEATPRASCRGRCEPCRPESGRAETNAPRASRQAGAAVVGTSGGAPRGTLQR